MITKFFLLASLLCIFFVSPAQSVRDQMMKKQPNCRDILINASDVLNNLYTEKSFDSMNVAVNIMEQTCGNTSPEVFYVKTLLAIQMSTFAVDSLTSGGNIYALLNAYIFNIKNLKYNGYSMGRYQYHYYYPQEMKFYTLIQSWAKDLLVEKKLTNSELFISNVLAGNFMHPEATVKSSKDTYPDLYALLQSSYQIQRLQTKGVVTLISGVWLPSGHMKILGAHPSLGFQLGGRGKSNEIDLTIQLRFGNTPGRYYVSRNDSLYSLDHYFGGYIGIDYTHYFFRSIHFETGVIGGIGYDGFDIADPGNNDHSQDYLKPFSIGSLNLNAGLRVNYYFNPRFFIGIAAKYNSLNYGNKNGSNLSGNPISIDFIIGR